MSGRQVFCPSKLKQATGYLLRFGIVFRSLIIVYHHFLLTDYSGFSGRCGYFALNEILNRRLCLAKPSVLQVT